MKISPLLLLLLLLLPFPLEELKERPGERDSRLVREGGLLDGNDWNGFQKLGFSGEDGWNEEEEEEEEDDDEYDDCPPYSSSDGMIEGRISKAVAARANEGRWKWRKRRIFGA